MTRSEIIKRQVDILSKIQDNLSDEDLKYLNFVIDNESRTGYWVGNAFSTDNTIDAMLKQIQK